MSRLRRIPAAVLCALSLHLAVAPAIAESPPDQGDEHAGHGHTDPLHFLHPLITESPLPENEARIEFTYADLGGGAGDEFTLTGTLELAPVRWFSLELSAPLSHLNPDGAPIETRLGNVGIGAKFATFAFEEHGLLLAAGVELSLPTGDDDRGIGNDHVLEVEPWTGFGFRRDRLEWLGRIGVGIPTNENGDAEADSEVEWATSVLVHLVEDKLAGIIEIDGLRVFGGDEDGFDSISITPGVRVFPFDNPDISLGLGVRLPLTSDRDSDVQTIVTTFFHF